MSSSRSTTAADPAGPPHLDGVTAVVLTYKRPRLAGDVTRSLLATEGFAPDRVILVVNGEGGLDDPALEADVHTIRLATNTGPAGGFRAGLEEAFADPATRWAYLCEDDVGLFDLPAPRVAALVGRIEARPVGPIPIGAVVAYGRCFVGRGAHTVNVAPEPGSGPDFVPVDVACWGATLVSRAAFEAGVLPDANWFFGLEDFDFFCRVRQAGFDVLVDAEAARLVAGQQTTAGRHQAIATERPGDADEAWRSYYHARNSIELIRRHGRPGWYAWQVAYAARQVQKARDGAERSAILHGVWDGARGRLGQHPRYGRRVGEFETPSAR